MNRESLVGGIGDLATGPGAGCDERLISMRSLITALRRSTKTSIVQVLANNSKYDMKWKDRVTTSPSVTNKYRRSTGIMIWPQFGNVGLHDHTLASCRYFLNPILTCILFILTVPLLLLLLRRVSVHCGWSPSWRCPFRESKYVGISIFHCLDLSTSFSF